MGEERRRKKMDDEKKGFVFYRSWQAALRTLGAEDRCKLYDAITDYALDGIEPKELSGVVLGMFYLIKPEIDSNNKKYLDGKKGGRPKKPVVMDDSENQKPVVLKKEKNKKPEEEVEDEAEVEGEEEKEDEVEKETLPPKSPKGDRERVDVVKRRFEEFWSVYPKKRSKESAWKAWQRLKPTAELHDQIVQSVRDHIARDPAWSRDGGQYIPYPATYLNGGGWNDELTPQEAKNSGYDDDFDPDDPFKAWREREEREERERMMRRG